MTAQQQIEELRKQLYLAEHAKQGGNQVKTAKALEINRNTLRKYLKQWGVIK